MHHHLRGKESEIHELQNLLAQKNQDIERLNSALEELQIMTEGKIIQLEDKLEENATTMQYLKKCIVKFLGTTDASEKRRLLPVIATILHFDAEERKSVEENLSHSLAMDSGALKSLWDEFRK
jgi:septal ring factor EnvC (AmiA/AmiB activator)